MEWLCSSPGGWQRPGFLQGCVSAGSRLLSADADGHIKCWSMTDHLANSWENTMGSMVEGDPVVALSWLHNGVKLALHVEKVRQGLAWLVGGAGKALRVFLLCCGLLPRCWAHQAGESFKLKVSELLLRSAGGVPRFSWCFKLVLVSLFQSPWL